MYKILSCVVVGLYLAGPVLAVPQMVARWPFDDGSGSGATETVAGLNGTLTNFDTSTAWTTDGLYGGALVFDGVDDYVIVPHNAAIDFANESFSVSFLLKQNGGFVAPAGTAFTEQRYFSKGTYAATTGIRYEMFNKGGSVRFSIDDGVTKVDVSAAQAPFVTNEWVHVVAVRDTAQAMMFLYANGLQVGSIATGALGSAANSDPLVFGTSMAADKPTSIGFFAGAMDDFRIFAKALTADEIATILADFQPEDGATDVARDTVLSWGQSGSAIAYNVYLGTSLDEVRNADINSLLLVGRGQDANAYDPAGLLELETTYYWRVDEIGAPPESKIVKGDVWSFTTELYAYPFANVMATASSSFNADSGPQKTVDGSGLNASDQHDTMDTNMWLSARGQEPPVWIQYEFDRICKLHQMWVWNSNNALEWLAGLGVKTATIEYSTDGVTWTVLENVPEFAQAPGAADYAANTTVDFGGVAARFVRITCTSSWGGGNQYGLSEVRFFSIPVLARGPEPATGATGVSPDTTLSWRAGREAALHEIHLGTDMQAVADSMAPAATVSRAEYGPANLQLDTTYYWKVVEVNQAQSPSAWDGDIWSFSTSPYLVVDDFEGYTNNSPNRVFQTWIDGAGFSPDEFFPNGNAGNGSGSYAGYDPTLGNIMETAIFHQGGRQSLPLEYSGLSEITQTFTSAQDWTLHGIKSLSLWFYGAADNAGQLYVKINNAKVIYNGGAADIKRAQWQPWNIDLATLGDTVRSVTSLTIGIEGAGATGKLCVDDIRLYRSAPAVNP